MNHGNTELVIGAVARLTWEWEGSKVRPIFPALSPDEREACELWAGQCGFDSWEAYAQDLFEKSVRDIEDALELETS